MMQFVQRSVQLLPQTLQTCRVREGSISDVISFSSLRFVLPMLLLGGLLAGCKGIPTRSEKELRQQVQSASSSFRPNGQKPTLPTLSTNSSLGDFLTYAMLNQPKVAAAYYDWLASVERVTTARSFPDPQLTFQMDIQEVVTSIMPGIMGVIPWPAKLHSAAEGASAESRAKYANFQSAVLENAFTVKRAYYQLHFLKEKIRVNGETLHLIQDLEKLARTQNEVGKVTLQDVLRAQIEQDRIQTELENLEDSRKSLLAQFKAALGIGSLEMDPPIPARFESTSLEVTSEKLFEEALKQNTQLRALEAELHVAEASLMMARRARFPDFSLGLMADAQMDPTLYRPLGTITLPIWRDKIAAQIAEAQANRSGAQARIAAEEVSLAADFAERMFLYREASRNLALLSEKLLPKARKSLEVARSGYLAGQIDFFNLTDSERTLLGFELDRVEVTTQRELVLAELALIVQGKSPTSMSSGNGAPGASSSKPAGKKMNSGM